MVPQIGATAPALRLVNNKGESIAFHNIFCLYLPKPLYLLDALSGVFIIILLQTLGDYNKKSFEDII